MEVIVMLGWWERLTLLRPGTMILGAKILQLNQIVKHQLYICWAGGIIWTIGYCLGLGLVKLRPEQFAATFFLNCVVTYWGIVLAVCLGRTGIASYVSDEAVCRVAEAASKSFGIWKPTFMLIVCGSFWLFTLLPPNVVLPTIGTLFVLAELMVGVAYQYAVAVGVKKALALSNEVKTLR